MILGCNGFIVYRCTGVPNKEDSKCVLQTLREGNRDYRELNARVNLFPHTKAEQKTNVALFSNANFFLSSAFFLGCKFCYKLSTLVDGNRATCCGEHENI